MFDPKSFGLVRRVEKTEFVNFPKKIPDIKSINNSFCIC